MIQTHQSHKTAQLRLLEIVQFPIETISLAKMRPLPFVARVFMQCESVVVQLEAKNEVWGIKRFRERQTVK
jgi:hypothetical protein